MFRCCFIRSRAGRCLFVRPLHFGATFLLSWEGEREGERGEEGAPPRRIYRIWAGAELFLGSIRGRGKGEGAGGDLAPEIGPVDKPILIGCQRVCFCMFTFSAAGWD